MARTPEGGLAIGRALPGRGAWLCAGSRGCLELAERRKALARAFRAPVEAAAVAALRVELAERARMENCGERSKRED